MKLLLGQKLVAQKEYSKALKIFLNLNESNNINDEILFYLGLIYFELNNFDKSAYYYNKFLEKKPNSIKALYNVAFLKQSMGEIEAAISGKLPNLMEPSMLKGAFHNHTTASDGTASLSQMAEAAQNLGWEFLGIADHSQILQIASGLSPDELVSQSEEIRALNENWADKGTDFRLFHGNECDILPDGDLDYSDEERSILDHVVGSVHQLPTWVKRDEDENTEALITAIENPSFTILGHPTGRILGGRDGFAVDLHAVLRRMGELNAEGELKVVEINASPYRLDLDWRFCRYAKEQGVPISINPDAHSPQGLKDVWFGAQIARKGWLEQTDILNCRSGADLEQLLW